MKGEKENGKRKKELNKRGGRVGGYIYIYINKFGVIYGVYVYKDI